MTTRRAFLGTLAAAATALAQAGRKKPNFVFLFTDDQRFDTIAALGHRVVKTPNMDRLVRRGVTFTHACTQGGMIGGICAPSRAQLMTGATVFRAHRRVVDAPAPDPEYVTFPERLREHGYAAFAVGKWHNHVRLLQRSFSSGANIFFGGMSNHLKTPLFSYNAAGEYPKNKAESGKGFSSEVFASTAVRFLNDHDRSKPFLLYVSFTSPHDPRTAPKQYADLYDPAKIELPKNFAPAHPFDNGNLRGRDEMLAGHPRTPEEVRIEDRRYTTQLIGDESVRRRNGEAPFLLYVAFSAPHDPFQGPEDGPASGTDRPPFVEKRDRATYARMVESLDENVGRVMDQLRKQGLDQNTAVFFMSDNGGVPAVARNTPFRGFKGSLWEGGIRTPFIARLPGQFPAGGRAPDMVAGMDLFPTCAALAGAPVPAGHILDGQSLVDACRGRSRIARDTLCFHYKAPKGEAQKAMVQRGWKYLLDSTGSEHVFHLAEDQAESRDLVNTQPERLGAMRASYERWKRGVFGGG